MPIEIPKPGMTEGAVALVLTAVGTASTILFYLLGDKSVRARIVAVVVAVAAVVLLAIGWYLARVLIALLRRAWAYPSLASALRTEETARATLEAAIAKALGAARLPISKFMKRDNAVKVALSAGTSAGLVSGQVVLVADDMEPIARGEIDTITATTAEAALTWFADPVAKGWFLQNISPLGLKPSADTVVISMDILRGQLLTTTPSQEGGRS